MSHEDQKVGELESVIIDPVTDEITHLIVKKGFLLTTDKLIPISLVADGNDERIKLHEFEGTIDDLQDYEETHFVPVENYIQNDLEGKIIPMIFYSPLSVSRSHAAQLTNVPVIKENLPPEKESLEEGMEITALDGEDVGAVKEIVLHPATDRVTHLRVSDGLLNQHEVLIPVEWVKEINESGIDLYVDSQVIKKLPEYEEERLLT
jgi:sporulation protein YlmC with PRC-barrel domain